jgi:hypothetical protein
MLGKFLLSTQDTNNLLANVFNFLNRFLHAKINNEFLTHENFNISSTKTSNLHAAASGAHNSSLCCTVGFELKTMHLYKKYRGQKF